MPSTNTPARSEEQNKTVGRSIRGSSLLLGGRFIHKGMNLATQVLIVRYLSQSDYGTLAYVLSIVAVGEAVAKFGMGQAVGRFLPIYHEQERYDALFGAMSMAAGVTLSIGMAIALFPLAAQGFLGWSFMGDQAASSLLLVLLFLVPVQAVDNLLTGVFAALTSPRLIFFRRHVMAPGLKLLVVLFAILGHRGVLFLAVAYLAASVLGLAVCGGMLIRLLRRRGLLAYFRLRSINMPWREILLYAIPLLSVDLTQGLIYATNAVLLRHHGGFNEVAAFSAAYRLALMNHLVLACFATLFVPTASRMFARRDHEEINNLYWQTAIWIMTFSFPVFVATFAISKPLTLLIYGARYEQAAIILSLLSLGFFFNAAWGPNDYALRVFGRVRYILIINIVTTVLNLVAALLLVPRFGALGAAIATLGTLIVHNILKHAGLRTGTGITLVDWRHARACATVASLAIACWVVQTALSPPLYVSLALAATASLLVVRLNRELLNAEQVFPKLMRLPLARQLLAC